MIPSPSDQDAYDDAMEPLASWNWEPPQFIRGRHKPVVYNPNAQSRSQSAIEAATQSLIGLPIGFVVSFAVGLLGLSAVVAAALITGLMFLASTVRGYLVRRRFERARR